MSDNSLSGTTGADTFNEWTMDDNRESPLSIVYGTHRVSGTYVFRDQPGSDSYDAAVMLCEGPVEEVVAGSIEVDGKPFIDLAHGGSSASTYTGTDIQAHDERFEKGIFQLASAADAGIDESTPASAIEANVCGGIGTGSEKRFFVKFDLTPLPQGITITKAEVVFTPRAVDNGGLPYIDHTKRFRLYECGNSWSENEVTWNTAPALGMTASTISFATGIPDTISDTGGGFLSAGFTPGMSIHVENSAANDGIYTIVSVSATTITINGGGLLTDEGAGSAVTISPVSTSWAPWTQKNHNRVPVLPIIAARYADGDDSVSFCCRAIESGISAEFADRESASDMPVLAIEYTFSSPSAYRNTAYIALSLKAGEKLSGGAEHDVTALAKGLKVRAWNTASQQWEERFSANPGWIVLDILTNERWPSPIGDEWIDLDSFRDAAAYFDAMTAVQGGYSEKRAECNIVFDRDVKKKSAIEQVLATCGAWLHDSEGRIRLDADAAVSVVKSFTDDDIALDDPGDGGRSSFSYGYHSLQKIPNEVRVMFMDAGRGYLSSYESAEDTEDRAVRGPVPLIVPLWGITRRTQASRMAHYILWRAKLRSGTARFTGGIAATTLVPGDVIAITHDLPMWQNRRFRVVETRERLDDEIEIAVEEYNESLYNDYMSPYVPSQEPVWEDDRDIPPDVTNLQLTETHTVLDDGTYIPRIRITFNRPDSVFPLDFIIYHREDGGSYRTLPQIGGWGSVVYDLENVPCGLHHIRVQTVNTITGVMSADPPEASITVLGKQTVPATPGAPVLTAMAGGLVIDWTAVDEADVTGYNVYVDTTSPATTFRAFVQATNWTFRGLGSQLYYVRITAVNSAGESAYSPEVSAATLAEGDFQVDDIDVPMLSGIVWSTNNRAEWTGGQIVYKGTIYTITGGNTTLKYIYWDADNANTQFQASATEPSLGVNAWVLSIYDSAADTIDHAFMGKIINGALMKAVSIHASRMILSSIDTSQLNNDAGWTDDSTADGKSAVYRQASAPASGMQTGDLWFDSDDGDKPYVYSGSSWIPAYTEINGGYITTGTISAARIGVGTFATGSSGEQRIIMDGSDGTIKMYDESDNLMVLISDGVPGGGGLGAGVLASDGGSQNAVLAPYNVYIESGNFAGPLIYAKGLLGDAYPQVLFAGYTSSDVATVRIFKSGQAVFAGTVEVATPTASSHAATKAYVDSVAGGVTDHGALTGLGGDDHSQYLNTARHDLTARHTLGSVVPHDAHGNLTGIGANDHHYRQHDLDSIADHSVDAGDQGKFLKVNTGTPALQWRSPSDVRSDIGAAASSHTHTSAAMTDGVSESVNIVTETGTNPGTNNPGYRYRSATFTNGILTSLGSLTWSDE